MAGSIKDRIVDRLNFMPSGNRSIKPNLVKKLKQSIKDYGILRSVVIVKTDVFGEGLKYYIADGQHLFMSVQALNMLKELNVIEVKKKFNTVQEIVEFVSVLNTSQSPWRLEDYIGAYASTSHYLSYNTLIKKRADHKLSYNLLAMIYGNISKQESAKLIKAGQFRVQDERRGDKIALVINSLIPLFGRSDSKVLYKLANAINDWYNSNIDLYYFKSYIADNVEDILVSNETEIISILSKYNKKTYV